MAPAHPPVSPVDFDEASLLDVGAEVFGSVQSGGGGLLGLHVGIRPLLFLCEANVEVLAILKRSDVVVKDVLDRKRVGTTEVLSVVAHQVGQQIQPRGLFGRECHVWFPPYLSS